MQVRDIVNASLTLAMRMVARSVPASSAAQRNHILSYSAQRLPSYYTNQNVIALGRRASRMPHPPRRPEAPKRPIAFCVGAARQNQTRIDNITHLHRQ